MSQPALELDLDPGNSSWTNDLGRIATTLDLTPASGAGAGSGYLSSGSLIPRRLRPAVQCHAHRKNGQQCRRYAMHGQRVCWVHGGAAPHARAAAQRRLEQAAVQRSLAREVSAMLREDVARSEEIRRLFGLPLTPVEEITRLVLAGMEVPGDGRLFITGASWRSLHPVHLASRGRGR